MNHQLVSDQRRAACYNAGLLVALSIFDVTGTSQENSFDNIEKESVMLTDKQVMIYYLAICAQNIELHKDLTPAERTAHFLISPRENMNWQGSLMVMEIIRYNIEHLTEKLAISPDQYEKSAVRFALDLLQQKEVWLTVETVATVLLAKSVTILTEKELAEIFALCEFSSFLEHHKNRILAERRKNLFNLNHEVPVKAIIR